MLEYERALMMDMPLVPLTFYVMLLFTCTVFHRLGLSTGKSPTGVEPSRYSLGILSTFTIGMSLLSGKFSIESGLFSSLPLTERVHATLGTGYGLMFIIGVPFTNLSQMVPFIILGVGLDDTFIITGAYFRRLSEERQPETRSLSDWGRDHIDQIPERIGDVMEEVGLSIALTTTTTTFAFCLGCFSSIPGIRWVCLCK